MSAFETKCAWLPCRKSLGVLVWRLSKFSTRQFCCEECAVKWREAERRNLNPIIPYKRLLGKFPEVV